MQRVLVGYDTPLGKVLTKSDDFHFKTSYRNALACLPICDEIVLISPSASSQSEAMRGAALIDAAAKAARHVTLISSIDVYPVKGLPLDEACAIPEQTGHHARQEARVRAQASSFTIVRLPQVFGLAASKDLPFGPLSGVNRVAIHQWYPAQRLAKDLKVARRLNAPIVNLCSQPLPMDAILAEFFPDETGVIATPAPYSRIASQYAQAFGGANGYIMTAQSVLDQMRACFGNSAHEHPAVNVRQPASQRPLPPPSSSSFRLENALHR